ncbi:transposon ty3-G gag-pol polyprotein [Tanacetum coccineum]
MAPSTRAISNSSVNGDGVDDNTRRYVDEALTGIRRSMEEMLNQITALSLQNQVVNGAVRPQTQYGRMTKVDFPKFSGEDVRGWIFRCEQFFLIDAIAEDQKVRLLSVHLFDKALLWHRQFLKIHGDNVTWPVYRDAIVQRFGTVFDDPMSELKNVKYDNSAKDYQDKFDDLLSMVDISVEHAISLYWGGLPTEIDMGVRMFKPQTLTDAYCLTNLQEATLNAVKKKSKMQFSTNTSRYGSNVATNTSNPKPLLALPNTTRTWNNKPNTPLLRKQLTQKEYEDKRAKNLCFYCDKKFVPGERQLVSVSECKGFSWKLRGETFTTDVMFLPLGGCDMVLGIQWLSTLGDIKCNFKELKMEFVYNHKKITLRGTQKSVVQMVTGKKQLNAMTGTTHAEIFMMCVYPNTGLSLMSAEYISKECVKVPELSVIIEEFDDVFALPTALPPKRTHDHRIPLLEGVPPVNIRPIGHYPIQKDVIDSMVKGNTGKEQLNKNTIKDKFPIPVIDELIDELHGAVIFSKLDLRSGYHQIRMFEDDIAKTAFRTHEGHYEFLVMPFGLTNAPSTFQALMNDVFKAYLRKFTLVFFDDILIYSKSLPEHVQHLTMILQTMRNNQLFAKKSKCVFGTSHVEYLGHVISAQGVATDSSKIMAMQEWTVPTNIKQLRGFLGLTGYYRKFIKDFASLSRPLTQLLKKNSYKWSDEAQVSFLALKEAMTKAPVLALPDFTIPFEVETDASGMGIGAVLQQKGHPIAYLSKSLAPKHHSLSTYEKEFLAVMMALEKWRGYLLDRHFIIKTDHYSLKYLLDQRITTPAQMKWLPKLMGFDYEVKYKKGVENAAADALSRVQTEGHLMSAMVVSIPADFITKIETSWHTDDTLQPILNQLQNGQQSKKHYSWSNGQLLRKNKLVVGQDEQLKLELLTYFHASSVGGHSGVKVTTHKLCSFVYWKGMRKEIKKFVKECITCQRYKPDLAAYPGLLQPLPIPNRIWESISMDFIEGLPRSKGFNVIFVVVDSLQSYAHFMPLSHLFSAMQVAQLFLDTVYKLHGLPTTIVSDRDKDGGTKVVTLVVIWLFKFPLPSSHNYNPSSLGQNPIHVPLLGRIEQSGCCGQDIGSQRTSNSNVEVSLGKISKQDETTS